MEATVQKFTLRQRLIRMAVTAPTLFISEATTRRPPAIIKRRPVIVRRPIIAVVTGRATIGATVMNAGMNQGMSAGTSAVIIAVIAVVIGKAGTDRDVDKGGGLF
ncbi:hypothetical protein TU78_05385 [Pseudomonas taetrolens]|uniref:Uncharacterized protein n=1 Tax=Pseudomonas taetrolens TaxID=47884 RepID=A0A0J6GWI1_PSETA|nr:hypothetical protein TU78_05385 [Pseudomonas taetrolens]